MEGTTDYDLEELESRLYSQVFHSTEKWDMQPVTLDSNLINIQQRHVSPHVVSNIPMGGNRYWDSTTNNTLQNKIPVTEDDSFIPNKQTLLPLSDFININSNLVSNCASQENSSSLNSIIPVETTVSEYRTKPLRYKSYMIPPTLELPKSEIKIFPEHVIQFFNLTTNRRKKSFRSFLRKLEKTNNNNSKSGDQVVIGNIPPEIIITTNGIDKKINISDIPISNKKSILIIPKFDNKQLRTRETEKVKVDIMETITLSDSDSDSVIEVPLSPIPVYNVDSSSESETESEDVPLNQKLPENILIDTEPNPDKNNHNEESNVRNLKENDKQIHVTSPKKNSLQESEQSNEKTSKSKADLHVSFTELEKERDEFLHTPDSNTNDFLEHDVRTLSKNNLSFNFGLHSSDLDLSKEKDECNSKSAHDHNLYETESSCSEIGSCSSKTRQIFNEINFESPIKDIFCEPDLSKFSNFITPNRSTQIPQTSNLKSNKLFTPVLTKARRNVKKDWKDIGEESKRRSRSDSSEYHSDATTLKIKKKNKKAKKKAKRKAKQSDDNEEEMEEVSTELISVIPTITSTQIEKTKIIEKNDTDVESTLQIPHLGPKTSKKSDEPLNKELVRNSPQQTKDDVSSKQIEISSVTDYYSDTYFADDTWMLEELSRQNNNPENIEADIEESVSTNDKINENSTNEAKSETSNKFSFIETWRKSTDKDCNTKEKKTVDEASNESPNKKIKTSNEDSPTIHPDIVAIDLSDEEKNSDSEITAHKNKGNPSSVVTANDDIDRNIIIINVKNGKPNSTNNNQFSFLSTYMQNKDKKSFRDFWTYDMNKFYNDSWGQENYDLIAAQASMSGNRADWIINQEDIYGISRRRRGPACLRCREIGHTQGNCTRFKGPVKCSICGYADHRTTRCPNTFCTNCRSPTHSITTSCGKCSHFRALECNICKVMGHETKFCPDLWRRYHLTTTSDTVLNTSSSILKSPSERWCSNCAKPGHCEDKCTYLRSYPYFPSSPGIISYAPTYDGTFKLPDTPPASNIPMFKNSNVTITDLKSMKKNAISDNNKKYINILKKLRQQCNKYDFQSIHQINRLQKNINSQEFSRKKIQEIYKIRARLEKQKVY